MFVPLFTSYMWFCFYVSVICTLKFLHPVSYVQLVFHMVVVPVLSKCLVTSVGCSQLV